MRERNEKKWKHLFLVLLTALLFFLPVRSVSALTIINTDVTSPGSGNVILGVRGKYVAEIQAALDRINAIRLEACKEGVPNPVNYEPLTMADYVPIKWSSDLEYIARIRAAESAFTMNHSRTTYAAWNSLVSPNGVRTYGENIAWNSSNSMIEGINQWYGEKNAWVKGLEDRVTGHYESLIRPDFIYIGLGTFCSNIPLMYNTTVAEFTRKSDLAESRGSSVADCIQLLEFSKNYLANGYKITGSTSAVIGNSVTLNCSASFKIDNYGNTLDGLYIPKLTWTSSVPSVASVTNGVVKALKPGKTIITATDANGVKATVTFTVTKRPQVITASSTMTKGYSKKTFTLGVKTNGDGKLTYSCKDLKVINITPDGIVRIINPGKATIKVYATETGSYAKSATKTITLTVTKANQSMTAKLNKATP